MNLSFVYLISGRGRVVKDILRLASMGFISALLLACGGDNDADGGGDGMVATSFQSIQEGVFTPVCSGCHGGASPSSGLNLSAGNAYANLVGAGSVGKSGAVRVIANDPDNSYLIQKLEGAADIAGLRMPRNGDALPTATIQGIRDWISAGALDN